MFFVFPLLQNCTIDRYLQHVSRHAHVGRLRLIAVNVSDAFCVLFRTFVFEKSSNCILFVPCNALYRLLVFVLSHLVCGCLTDIFIYSLSQNCTIDWYLQGVSRHVHVGHLRLIAVNVWDAFCVLFRTFVFGKVHIVSCSIHEMHFMIFGFCSVTYRYEHLS